MIARTCTSPSPSDWNDFLAMLPTIRDHACYRLRQLDPESREDAVQEVIANAAVAFVRLVEQGRADVARPTPLANYAVAQFLDGRRVGNRLNIRDVSSPHCQKRKGIRVRSLHCWDKQDHEWKEIAVEDRRSSPAETAAFRIDFDAWLKSLGSRNRRIALTLAGGESTGRAARRFRISSARISQLRREFARDWARFQGEEPRDLAGAAVEV